MEETKCYCGHTTYCDCGPEEPKQTAVEWLEEKFINEFGFKFSYIEQAKEMEKEQLIRAFTYAEYSIYINSGEQYYKETFKNK